jgi:hypothetical protein
MVAWWTSPTYWKRHEGGKLNRGMMEGGTHHQGSAPLQVLYQRKVSKCIIYSSCQVNIFSMMAFLLTHPLFSLLQTLETGQAPQFLKFWQSYRERKGSPDRNLGMCMNLGNKQRIEAYERKYKEKYGADADPYTGPFDTEVTHLDLVHICSVVQS